MSHTNDSPSELPELTRMIRGSPGGRASVRKRIDVGHRYAYFPEYTGPLPKSLWQKPIVGPPDRPFAELQVAKRLEEEDEGWRVAWVYRPTQFKFISTWEPRASVQFPDSALALLERIQNRAGGKGGCWDLFGWKDGKPLFAELKRGGSSDRVRPIQWDWRKAALDEGVDPSAFDVIEWYGGALKNRILRLTTYTYAKPDGWAEWRNGRITYRGTIKSIVDHYRGWGAKTEAGLLWLVFARNHSGITWCDFRERRVSS